VGGGELFSAKCRKNFWSCPSTSVDSKVQFSCFGERFRDGQYSFFCQFLVCCSTDSDPRAQPFVKVGERAPVPYGVGTIAYEGLTDGHLNPWIRHCRYTENELIM